MKWFKSMKFSKLSRIFVELFLCPPANGMHLGPILGGPQVARYTIPAQLCLEGFPLGVPDINSFVSIHPLVLRSPWSRCGAGRRSADPEPTTPQHSTLLSRLGPVSNQECRLIFQNFGRGQVSTHTSPTNFPLSFFRWHGLNQYLLTETNSGQSKIKLS